MHITFYDTRVTEDYLTTLVVERKIQYPIERYDSPNLIAEFLNDVTGLNVKGEEHCYMVALNVKNRILGIFLVSKGTVNQSVLGTREVFMRALLVGASHIILCHNHPSGDCFPSRDDINLTKRFKEAGELLGIPLTDHVVVGGDNYFSFAEKEML